MKKANFKIAAYLKNNNFSDSKLSVSRIRTKREQSYSGECPSAAVEEPPGTDAPTILFLAKPLLF